MESKSGYLEQLNKVQGPVSFLILLDVGEVVHRHIDHVKSRETMPEQASGPVDSEPLEVQETIINEYTITDDVVQQRPVRIYKPPSRLIE